MVSRVWRAKNISSLSVSFEYYTSVIKQLEGVFLCLHEKGPKWNYTELSKYIKMSKSFVHKWCNHYTQYKNVDDLPSRCLKRSTTGQVDKKLLVIR